MVTQTGEHVVTAPVAQELALITYRQLDHWARKGWVVPSAQSGSGRGGRRLYSPDDILRLGALRHFAKSGWTISAIASTVATIPVTTARWLVAGSVSSVSTADTEETLFELLAQEEQLTVFDLEPLRQRIAQIGATESTPTATIAQPRTKTA